MLAKRLPVLSAFAIGCLSGAALLATWRYGPEQAASPARAPERNLETIELAFADAVAQERDAPSSDATSQVAPSHTEELAAEPATETGASAADVLVRLEAQYRQGLAAAPPAAPATAVDAPAIAPPVVSPPVVAAPVAAPPVIAPATAVVAAPPVSAPPANTAPVLPPNPTSPPPEAVAARDVQQNVHVGDVYQVQLQQQLAVLQYMQLLGLSSYGGLVGPASTQPRGARRRTPPFPTSLTNPDNPWGFDFPPTVLVK